MSKKRDRDKYDVEELREKLDSGVEELKEGYLEVKKKIQKLEITKQSLENTKYALELVLQNEEFDRTSRKKPHKVLGQIFVKLLTGQNITLNDMIDEHTIEYVKYLIWKSKDLKPCGQRLIWAGKQLEDGRTLKDYGIKTESTLTHILRLGGC